MLISHKYCFIYTKTIKTAGTSVEIYFQPFCTQDDYSTPEHATEEYVSETGIIGFRGKRTAKNIWYNHMPAQLIRDSIGKNIWNKYHKFCAIRNPFDKLLSFFYWRERHNLDRSYMNTENSIITTFRQKVLSRELIIHDRTKFIIDGNICVDQFIRFEALEHDIRLVCERVGVPFEHNRIPRLKTGIRKHNSPMDAYYDKETVDFVATEYSFEIEYFNYPLPII